MFFYIFTPFLVLFFFPKIEELKQSGFFSVSKALEQTAKIGKIEENFSVIRSKI